MKKIMLVLTGTLLLGAGTLGHAADIQAGKDAYTNRNCASCHGADAKTSVSPEYPIIAGQYADYLEHALRAYQRGASGAPATANIRKNPIMGAMAAPLGREEIENIAAWLSTLDSPLSVRR